MDKAFWDGRMENEAGEKAPRIREKNKTLAHIPPIKKNPATFLWVVNKSTFPTKTPHKHFGRKVQT